MGSLKNVGVAVCASLVLIALVAIAVAWESTGRERQMLMASADPFRPVFTLGRDLRVDTARSIRLDTLDFDLPDDARQGIEGWYILDVDLDFDLDLSADMNARSYVSVLTDGRAAAQIEFQTETIGDRRVVRWSTLELFSGAVEGIVPANSLKMHYRNYLQNAGVRPGTNALSLQLEHYNGVVVQSASLRAGSQISHGAPGPPGLGVAASVTPARVRIGDTLALRYGVASRGIPARDVTVDVHSTSPGLIATDVPNRYFEWVSRQEGMMQFRALAPGKHQLTVDAIGKTGGSATKTMTIEVLKPSAATR